MGEEMQANPIARDDTAPLFPFPEGWYFVASRKALRKEKLIQKTWLGQEIVVWSDAQGRICVSHAVCPHLGSQLGPAAGGQVRDGCLVCPFHGFEYDITGQCVATPYAPAPRSARLKVFETRELCGMIFAWWGLAEGPPRWDLALPDESNDDDGWCEVGFRFLRFPGHPQETAENAVDLAHLRYVHGYDKVEQVGSVSVDGAYLKNVFNFTRSTKILGIVDTALDITAVAHVLGLGYSYVEIQEHSIGMDWRLWVLATPIDGTRIEMVLAGQVRAARKPKRPIIGLRFLPQRLRAVVINSLTLSAQKRDVLQDVAIWGRKRYRQRPLLNRSDGEIWTYRRYCEQFYPGRGGVADRDEREPRIVRA